MGGLDLAITDPVVTRRVFYFAESDVNAGVSARGDIPRVRRGICRCKTGDQTLLLAGNRSMWDRWRRHRVDVWDRACAVTGGGREAGPPFCLERERGAAKRIAARRGKRIWRGAGRRARGAADRL